LNTIETDRLILRGWKETDYLDLYEFISDDRVAQNAGYKAIKDIEASKNIIKTYILHNQSYAIELKSEKKVIGSIGIDDIAIDKESQHLRQRYIGYTLNSNYWGKGYATEAVKFLIKYLFEELHLDFVWSSHYDFNTKSRRVLERSGLKYKFNHEVLLKAIGNVTAKEMFYVMYHDGCIE